MALENDFLRRAFKRVKEARSKNSAPGEARCTVVNTVTAYECVGDRFFTV
jgi:hypothetical protein